MDLSTYSAEMGNRLELERITASPRLTRQLPALEFPHGTAPVVVQTNHAPGDPLPKADVLIVTYTMAEAMALADILTPGLQSKDWTLYKNGWPAIKKLIEGDRAPSLFSKAAGAWALITIGTVRVIVMKSDLHPATDGPNLPVATAWKQWVEQAQPKLVITTGTAGAVQGTTQLGDVVVTGNVKWDCKTRFKDAKFAGQAYTSAAAIDPATFTQATAFLQQTAASLPNLTRAPKIWLDGTDPVTCVSTDYFAFDDVADTFGLRAYDPTARVVEMDDAAAAYAIGDTVPWLSIRNASDPQMNGASERSEAKQAAQIYTHWGQVTSWGSVVTCWAACLALR